MWGLISLVAGFIWHGLETAIVFTVHWLTYMVMYLWNVVLAAGRLLTAVGRKIWTAIQATYSHVLKPAWTKFYKFVNRVHDWLDRHFAPLLKKVNALRTKVFGYWKRYVRPIIDVIDAVRGTLRVLAALHIEWAKQLDAELGRLEALIEKPFLELIRRLNELADWINRIIGLDGLFNRVILLNSTFKNVGGMWKALTLSYTQPIDPTKRQELHDAMKGKRLAAVQGELREFYATGGGAQAPLVSENAAQWRLYFTVQ